MRLADLVTPALVVDAAALTHNLDTMTAALPGRRLRPHVKAHKCTGLAREQAARGHVSFTCATVRECEGMAASGLGEDLLLANEVLDARRLGSLVAEGHGVTVAVDSIATARAAASGGVRQVLVDVFVGLRRCGCRPEAAGMLAETCRELGLEVRGVMGYEGHVVGRPAATEREALCREAMELLAVAHEAVGGEVVSAGGTGTYECNSLATEIQAGSYALMDAAYQQLGLPFRQAVFVLATVVSSSAGWSVLDCGLKAFGMDHGNPVLPEGDVWFCSDEHLTFAPPRPVGERVLVTPSHVDPTVAYHERMHLLDGDHVLETWPVDLRGW